MHVVSFDLDPQEPGSQSELAILHGQFPQEPSIKIMDDDKEITLSETIFIQTTPDNAQGSLSMTAEN